MLLIWSFELTKTPSSPVSISISGLEITKTISRKLSLRCLQKWTLFKSAVATQLEKIQPVANYAGT